MNPTVQYYVRKAFLERVAANRQTYSAGQREAVWEKAAAGGLYNIPRHVLARAIELAAKGDAE